MKVFRHIILGLIAIPFFFGCLINTAQGWLGFGGEYPDLSTAVESLLMGISAIFLGSVMLLKSYSLIGFLKSCLPARIRKIIKDEQINYPGIQLAGFILVILAIYSWLAGIREVNAFFAQVAH